MKIVFLTSDDREVGRNYDVPMPRLAAGIEQLFDGFARCPEVEFHIVSCAQQPMKPVQQLNANIWHHSLHVPKTGWLRTLYQGCVRAVRKKVREIQPDIVHGNGTERYCALSAALSGFPNVVSIQGNMAELARLMNARFGSYHWLAAHLENFTLRRTQGVLCNSTYTENLVRPRARQTWLLPHALRSAFFAPIPDTGSRPCVLLNAGVISPRKQQLELLDVAEALHRRGLRFEFRFIGHADPSPYMEAFLARIKPMTAAGYARYLGEQPNSELIRRFDEAAGCLHFPTEEAFGNVVVEGLGRNLKFFGARVGGIIDIAAGVPGAELFDKKDWAGLTDAIARWIAAGHPRPAHAAAIMRERYSPETIARRHLEIYREVLGRS